MQQLMPSRQSSTAVTREQKHKTCMCESAPHGGASAGHRVFVLGAYVQTDGGHDLVGSRGAYAGGRSKIGP